MIGRKDVEAAWGLIRPHVRRTPVIELRAGSLGLGSALALKLESLQVSGTFKGRGAFHKLLASKVPAAGIIAASGGNHGVAAAYAARALGHKAEIFVPTISSPAKVARLKSYGTIVHQIGAVYAEARAASEKRAVETGALMVQAYEDPVVFAGAGSVALEFAEQATFDTLLVAVGGGGLIAGCAAAIGEGTKIVAVETEGTPTLHEALRAGHPVDVKISGIAADALGASRIGVPNFEVAAKLVRGSVLVSDDAVRKAQRALWEELHVVAEPSGAAGLAALMAGAYRPAPGERVATLICGANTDPGSVVLPIMRRRLSARLLILDQAGRVLLFRFVYRRGPLAGQDFWGTPGGGVEDGETLEQAALRELVEETGLRRDSVGSEVARREVALQLPDGERVVQDERYFVVRVADNALSRDDWTELEREVMVEHRWWSLDDLSRTEATVWPENLSEMIDAALG